MASSKKDYLGLSRIVSIILAIIPITSIIFGLIARFKDGNILAFVVRLIVYITGIGALILWIIDLVLVILKGSILRLL